MILCVRAQPEKDIEDDTVYIWRGPDFDEEVEEGLTSDEFLDKVI